MRSATLVVFALPLLLAATPAIKPAAKSTAQAARVARAADLRAEPANGAELLQVLAADTQIGVLERRGGWYRVTVGEGGGWLRLTAVRFATGAQSDGGASASLRFLQSGRKGVTTGTVTTGVRGLSEADLANAVPDPAAVDRLDALAVPADDARRYAADLKLQAVKVDYVPLPEPEGGKKRKRR
jgi:hypothetical protein